MFQLMTLVNYSGGNGLNVIDTDQIYTICTDTF